MSVRQRAVLGMKCLLWIGAAVVTGGVVLHAERHRVVNDLEHIGASVTLNDDEQPVAVSVHSGELSGSHLGSIGECTHLRSFVAANCRIDAEGLPAVYALPELRALELSFVDCPPGSLGNIGRAEQLMELRLLHCSWVDDAEIEHLLELDRLQSLNLTGTSLTDAGLARLAELPALEELTIDGCAGVTEAGLLSLATFPALQRVGAEQLNVQPESYRALREANPSLSVRSGLRERWGDRFARRHGRER